MSNYLDSKTCDEPDCDKSPAKWVGDIYYACEDHVDGFRELVSA